MKTKFTAMSLLGDEETDFLFSERQRLRKIYRRLHRKRESVISPRLLVSYRKNAIKLPDEISTLWKLAYATLLPIARDVCHEYHLAEQQKVERRLPHQAKKQQEKPTIYSRRRRV